MPPPPSSRRSPSSTHDGNLFMKENNLFLDNLEDLKNIRSQLYSAAEYFESTYKEHDEGKHLMVGTLKDYIAKAVVNTIDHLGSVSFKVDAIVSQKLDEITEANLRVSSIEQALRTCLGCVDRAGLSQQTLDARTPKYHHKRYILPAGEVMPESGRLAVACGVGDDQLLLSDITQRAPSIRRVISRSRLSFDLKYFPSTPSSGDYYSLSPPAEPTNFTFPERRTLLPPLPNYNPTKPSTSLGSFRSFKSTLFRSPRLPRKFPMDLWRSNSMRVNGERGSYSRDSKGTNPNKLKGFIKSILRQPAKTKKDDDTLYDYLDHDY